MHKFIPSFIFIIIFIASFSHAEETFQYDAHGKRDPFLPLISEGAGYVSDVYGISEIKDVALEGIVWDEAAGSFAIINGEIVREGDLIGTIKVLKIEKDYVVFEINGEELKKYLVTE